MKTSRKSLSVVVSLICIAGASSAAYGTFWVASNVVHVDMPYTVALSYSVSRNHASLTATVTINGSSVGAGINVDFYYSFNGGEWTFFDTQPTNRNGVARTRLTITANGVYDFKATVP